MKLTPEHFAVTKYALETLIELLKSPTSADRDADAAMADRHIQLAEEMKAALQDAANPLSQPLQNLLGYVERDTVNNAPGWRPHDVPEYVDARTALKACGINYVYVDRDLVDEAVEDALARAERHDYSADEENAKALAIASSGILNLNLNEDEIEAARVEILNRVAKKAEDAANGIY